MTNMAAGFPLGEKTQGQIDTVQSSKTRYIWKIERFDTQFHYVNTTPRLKSKLVSQSFTAGEDVGIKSSWHIEIGNVEQVTCYYLNTLIVFEKLLDNTDLFKPFSCLARFSLVNPENYAHIRTLWGPTLADFEKLGNCGQTIYSYKIENRSLLELMVDNAICFSFELEIILKERTIEMGLSDVLLHHGNEQFGLVQLQQDLEELFNCEASSDFKIQCGKKCFYVHKVILRVMLNNENYKECETNTMIIEDFDEVTVEILLKYIYTGEVSKLMDSENIWTVIQAADKYGLTELKNYGFAQLTKSITEDNFGSLSILAAAIHADEKLLGVLKKYYEWNLSQLMKNAEFRELVPQLPEFIFKN